MTSTRTRLAGLVLLALATLSGCGGLHPGIAAEVGDQSITDAEVDQLAQDVCTAVQSQPDADRAASARSHVAPVCRPGLRAARDGRPDGR